MLRMEDVEINGVRAKVARTLFERVRGLIGTRHLPPGEGMLILRCNCIHTFFMSFPIDATFLDRDGKVSEADAIYLLRHILFPDKYAIYAWSDFDSDGKTSEADAIYLLRHVLFPEKYPLKQPAT